MIDSFKITNQNQVFLVEIIYDKIYTLLEKEDEEKGKTLLSNSFLFFFILTTKKIFYLENGDSRKNKNDEKRVKKERTE